MDIHNGIHIYKEPHVEWWYFNFISDQGFVFNFLLHPTNVFGGSTHHYMSITMIDPNKEIHYFNKELGDNIFNDCIQTLHINTENLTIYKNENKQMILKCKFDNLQIDSVLISDCDPYYPNNGLLYENKNKNINWIIPIPNGYFKMEMKLFGKDHLLHGNVYHDHDWGNLLLEDAFNGWFWMHVILDKGHMVIHNIFDKNDKEYMNCYFIYDNIAYKFVNGKTNPPSWKNELTTNFEIEIDTISCNGVKLNCILNISDESSSIIREHSNELYKYYRSSISCKIKMNDDIFTGCKGMFEHLLIK